VPPSAADGFRTRRAPLRCAAVAGIILAGASLAPLASAARRPPRLALTPAWNGGKIVRVHIRGQGWVLGPRCPKTLRLFSRLGSATAERAIASVTLRRPTASFAYAWRVPSGLRGRVVVFSAKESCVSARGDLRVYSAWASLKIP
jgi:hypothetical protein